MGANIAVLCHVLLGDNKAGLQVLIKAGRLPEAAFFARSYCPSELSGVVALWKGGLANVNQTVADVLAYPKTHPDLFPDFDLTLQAEAAFKVKSDRPVESRA